MEYGTKKIEQGNRKTETKKQKNKKRKNKKTILLIAYFLLFIIILACDESVTLKSARSL